MSEIPRKMVMVVEDDPEIRALLGAFLTREGFEVELAADGTAMDRVLRQRTPDLVILDLMLPGEDGLSICRRLRSRSSLPILFLTAKGDDTDRIVGLELGADDYITKPFNPRELLARMRAVLRRAGRLPCGRSTEAAVCLRELPCGPRCPLPRNHGRHPGSPHLRRVRPARLLCGAAAARTVARPTHRLDPWTLGRALGPDHRRHREPAPPQARQRGFLRRRARDHSAERRLPVRGRRA